MGDDSDTPTLGIYSRVALLFEMSRSVPVRSFIGLEFLNITISGISASSSCKLFRSGMQLWLASFFCAQEPVRLLLNGCDIHYYTDEIIFCIKIVEVIEVP